MKKSLPQTFYNPLSLVGAVVFFFNIGLMIFLAVVEMFSKHPKPYADIIIFMVLPLIVSFRPRTTPIPFRPTPIYTARPAGAKPTLYGG